MIEEHITQLQQFIYSSTRPFKYIYAYCLPYFFVLPREATERGIFFLAAFSCDILHKSLLNFFEMGWAGF